MNAHTAKLKKLKRQLEESVASGRLPPVHRRAANSLLEAWKNPTPNQFIFINRMIDLSKQIRFTPENNYNQAKVIKYDKQGNEISNKIVRT